MDALQQERYRRERLIGAWLMGLAAMVFVMVVIGGLTRLTQSGLSMVEWRPITGWLPPLSQEEWEALFAAYRQTPEYRHVNAGMTLVQFEQIFWLEFVHRLWGRLIGVAFLVPFVVFLAKGWIGRTLAPWLAAAFVLGGLQGALGWFMVASGLVDRPDVSQYRLTAHLGAALLIYGYLLWLAWTLLKPRAAAPRGEGGGSWGPALAVSALVVVTVLAGGFVAGLDGGLVYNTFPLMGGSLVPADLFPLTPFYLSLFEDAATAQFAHRILALSTLAAILAFWIATLRGSTPQPVRQAAHGLALAALIQVGLGIATLLLVVPVALAAAHQAGAVILFTIALWCVFVSRPPPRVLPSAAQERTPLRDGRYLPDVSGRPKPGERGRPGSAPPSCA